MVYLQRNFHGLRWRNGVNENPLYEENEFQTVLHSILRNGLFAVNDNPFLVERMGKKPFIVLKNVNVGHIEPLVVCDPMVHSYYSFGTCAGYRSTSYMNYLRRLS